MKICFKSSLCPILLFAVSVVPGSAQEQKPPAEAPPPRPLTEKIQQPPPLPPKVPDVRQPGETGYSIGFNAWFPTQQPTFDKGRGATFDTASFADLQGKPKLSEGVDIGIALGLHNALRLSYFEGKAAGNFTTPNDIRIWNQDYAAGTYLSTNYRLQSGKLSFDYLTWPYPVESRKFRLKTLWQVQWTSMRTIFDAPKLPLVDDYGQPLVDSSGNPISYAGQGTRWFISPEIGLGAAYFSGRHFRLEANATGFTIPHHTSIWDADASANVRYGHFELRVGAKAFHFKSSTQAEYYMRGTMAAPFVGIRWYSE